MFVCQGPIYTKGKLPAGPLLTSPTPTPSSQSAVVPAKHRHPSVHQSPPQPHPNALFQVRPRPCKTPPPQRPPNPPPPPPNPPPPPLSPPPPPLHPPPAVLLPPPPP